MNFCTVFAIFIIIECFVILNVDTEPVFRESSRSEIQKNKRIIVKQTGGHDSKHRGHHKPMQCMCVTEVVNASSVTAISGVLIPEPDVFFPGTVVDPVIVIPGDGSSVTTATTGAATTFVPGM